jgi:hypothetical protein
MAATIEFYAGNAKAIAGAVQEGEDPRKLKNTLGYVNLSFHLPPITSIDPLVEAGNQVMGSELPSFEEALEDGQILEDEQGKSVDVVESEWVKSFAELKEIPIEPVFETWITIMSEEEGARIKPSPKLKVAVEDLFKLIRKSAGQKASLVHVWSF